MIESVIGVRAGGPEMPKSVEQRTTGSTAACRDAATIEAVDQDVDEMTPAVTTRTPSRTRRIKVQSLPGASDVAAGHGS